MIAAERKRGKGKAIKTSHKDEVTVDDVARMSGLPVRCVSLTYRTPPGCAPANLAVCWWGGMAFPGHLLKLFQLPGVHATVEFGQESIRHEDRKVLANLLWEAVSRRFRPVVG